MEARTVEDLQHQLDQCQSLLAELEKLRAVAEAARALDYNGWLGPLDMEFTKEEIRRLRDAVNALDALKEKA